MPARVSFVERRFSLDLDGFTPAERSANLAAFAKQELASEIASGDAPPSYTRFVDGIRDAPEEAVRPDRGVILYAFAIFPEVARAALEYLRANSPEASGAYRDSHFLLVNGAKIDDPDEIPSDADSFMVSNDQPYARKIEVGHMQMTVPHLIYDHAHSAIQSLYGQVVKVDIAFVELQGGYVLKGRFSRGYRAGARQSLRKDAQAGTAMTYPTLIISRR